MKNGWIKMHRTLLESSIFDDAELLRVLIYCVLQASYRKLRIPVGRQVITLQPGQLLYGRKAVSSRLGIGESKLRGLMNQLEQMGILAVESSNRYSIVTILQWDAYQNEKDNAAFPFDCDFLDEEEAEEDNQQESAELTVIEDDFEKIITSREPSENHKQEEKNHNKNNNKIKKERENKTIKEQETTSWAALRAVRRYRRADGELFTKGKCECGAASTEGHSVPGGEAAVSSGNSADAQDENSSSALPEDWDDVLMELNKIYEQERMEQQNQVDLDSLTWDIDDDMNWGIDLQQYAESCDSAAEEIDADEQEWIEAHKLFNQLWNKYPIKEGKHKVSDAQIMELYAVGKEPMLQAISNYKEKKHRVPKKYWMNGSTFFNGGYRRYLS